MTVEVKSVAYLAGVADRPDGAHHLRVLSSADEKARRAVHVRHGEIAARAIVNDVETRHLVVPRAAAVGVARRLDAIDLGRLVCSCSRSGGAENLVALS